MNNPLTAEPSVEETTQIQNAIQQHLVEIELLRERMQRDQSEIEKSRARTHTILTRIQAQMTQLLAS